MFAQSVVKYQIISFLFPHRSAMNRMDYRDRPRHAKSLHGFHQFVLVFADWHRSDLYGIHAIIGPMHV
jgi:hypothetical protein